MTEQLKSHIESKTSIEKYGFVWLPEAKENFDNLLDLAACKLSHKLLIVLAYHTGDKKYFIYFDHPRLGLTAELSDDFFAYLYNTYVMPAKKIGIDLSEEEYRSRRLEFKEAFIALREDLGDRKRTKEFSLYLGEEDWCELMTFLENNMVMNPMLTPHASLMHMATVHADNFTASCTQASTSQFYIDANYSSGSTEFTVIFSYFPDNSKYNAVPQWIKTHKELAAVPAPMPKGIPKDLPMDVFGALLYLFGTPQ